MFILLEARRPVARQIYRLEDAVRRVSELVVEARPPLPQELGRLAEVEERRAEVLEHDVVCRPEFAVANPFDILECAALGLRLGKKTVADMFRTAAAINDTAVLARAYMGYVESVRRVEPRLLAEIDIFACRGRVGGVDVAFKSVDGRCKISSVGAAVEELVDRSFER